MSKPLRVVHITSAHKDGDVRIFHKECVSLAAAGFEVSLVIPNTKSRVEKGVNIVSFEDKGSSRFGRAINTVNRVFDTAIKLNADVYHLHDPELLRLVPKFKNLGKKVVYDSHEDLPRQVLAKHYIPAIFRKLVSNYFERFENRKTKMLDGIIAATPVIRDRFLKNHPNTVDVQNMPILNEFIDLKRIPAGRTICYVGSISEIRGVYELVSALSEADCKLILAGEFDDESFKLKVMNHPNWKRVQFLGFANRDQVKQIYSQSVAGIVTLYPVVNYLDALPVKMFEYMASGIPVIASDFPLWKKILDEGDCGMCVNPKDPKKIAETIKAIFSNEDRANEMGQNGKRQVLNKYNWEIEKKKLIEFYQKLAANGK
jgi:glycosyltransferase involved in cell wall biosynthesis